MKNLIYFFSCFLLCFCSFNLFSQVEQDSLLTADSTIFIKAEDTLDITNDSIPIDVLFESTDSIIIDSTKILEYIYTSKSEFNRQILDSSINSIHRYDPVQKYSENVVATIGNIGLAATNLVFNYKDKIWFDKGADAFSLYLFDAEFVKYYDLYRPFSEVTYVTGAEKERLFNIVHAQKINKFISTSLQYQLVNSPGKYIRQGVKNANFYVNTKISTNKSKYVNRLAYSHNRIDVSENGGVVNKNDIEEDGYDAIVNFTSSHQVSNWIKTNTYYVDHSLAFGNYRSIDSVNNKYKHSIGYLGHEFKFDRNWSIFEDPDPTIGYFPYTYKDTTSTYDSLYFMSIRNNIYWSNYRSESYERKLNFRFGIAHQYVDIAQTDRIRFFNSYNFYDTTYIYNKIETSYLISNKHSYNNLIPNVYLNIRDFFYGFNLIFDGKFALNGYNHEDFNIKGSLIKNFTDSSTVFAAIGYSQQEPDWIFKNYDANSFIWEFDLNKTKNKFIRVGIDLSKLRTSVNVKVGQLSDYTYFNKFARPTQYSSNLTYIKAQASKKISFWRIDFDNFFTYQAFDNTDVIHLPLFISRQSLYVKFALFNKALYSNVGADLTYYTKYNQNYYMPATRMFYLQNDVEVGNYPYLDIFANFKIRTVRIFLKFSHLNSGLNGSNYFMIPNYPVDQRSFKFGVIWKFNN